MSVRQQKTQLKQKYEQLVQEQYEMIKQRNVLEQQLNLLKRNIATFWDENFYLFRTILRAAKTTHLSDYYFHSLSKAETEMALDYLEDMVATTQDNEEKFFLRYNIEFTKSQISAGCPGSKIRLFCPVVI